MTDSVPSLLFIPENLATQDWNSLTLNGVFLPDPPDKFWDDKRYLKNKKKKKKKMEKKEVHLEVEVP